MAELTPGQQTALDRFVSVLRGRLRDAEIASLRERLREARKGEKRFIEETDATLDHLAGVRKGKDEQIRRLTAALRGLMDSGVGFDDERIKYITVQINREDWRVAGEVLAESER